MASLPRQLLRSAIGAWKNQRQGTEIDYGAVALAAKFGNRVSVMAGSRVDEHCDIGAYTYIGYGCHVSRCKVGRYTSIANNCSVGPGEHPLGALSTSSYFSASAYDDLTKDPVTLGSDVWLGVDAIIRRGVTIGDGAVVGANSFVNEDVPPFAVVAGSPARLLRYRFPAAVRALLLREKWWNLELAEAKVKLEELAAQAAQLPQE